MKKYLFLLLALPFFFGCSDDSEETQDYTSYVIEATGSDNFIGAKTGYFDKDGKCILLHEIGTLDPDKDTQELILDNFHPEIYLFYAERNTGGTRLEKSFNLKKDKKNIIKLTEDNWKGINIPERTIYTWPH
jgi:Transcriptional regulators containing an AAA-type ATPase domain and a DNA-binding domain